MSREIKPKSLKIMSCCIVKHERILFQCDFCSINVDEFIFTRQLNPYQCIKTYAKGFLGFESFQALVAGECSFKHIYVKPLVNLKTFHNIHST